jgi:hypothetical protein
MSDQFIEGEDFEVTNDGKVVMTSKFLLKRGRCCSSGCSNCPYGYAKKVDPSEPPELSLIRENKLDSSDPFSDEAIQLKLDLYSDELN